MQSKVAMEIETETDSNLVREMILICVENRCGTAQPSRHIFLISTQLGQMLAVLSCLKWPITPTLTFKLPSAVPGQEAVVIPLMYSDLQLIWGLL